MADSKVLPHNVKAAATWNAGGHGYDGISETTADALEHCVIRLDPKPGERVLDVGTGTGWTARRAAARGAIVTGVDLGADLVAAAKARAEAAGYDITFRVGDAEKLPFDDGRFDVVVSTFGVMFVRNPEAAASELARVCRRGGRLGLTTWPADGTVAGMFNVIRPYMPPLSGPAPPSPFAWGNPERLRELLADSFDLRFETGTNTLRLPGGQAVWDLFSTGFGPTRSLLQTLDPARAADLKRDFIAYHVQYRNELGIAMPRNYLVTIGTRK